MSNAIRVLGFTSALALAAGPLAAQQNHNDTPLNNGGDVVYFYSSPSSGASALGLPDITGDLYWRSHSGKQMMNDVDAAYAGFGGASSMEIDGYVERIYDTDWVTPPSFYVRAHGPALPDLGGLGNLEPAFFQSGLTTEQILVVGPSGFGSPCTVAPSLCSPAGGTCPAPGFVVGYILDLEFIATTLGSGIVLPATGTAASDMATTYFITGGMSASGGVCGSGDYVLQDLHSTNETMKDPLGGGINPSGGLQLAGSGAFAEADVSMALDHERWRGNVINVRAKTDTGAAVEIGDASATQPMGSGGGAMNGRYLSVGGGTATIGAELRDFAGIGSALGIVGASQTAFPNPGFSIFGANLLVSPTGLFNATSAVWQGPIAAVTPSYWASGILQGAQLAIPPSVVSGGAVTIYIQGARLAVSPSFSVNTTNAVAVELLP